jgi:hypothetical protein
LNLLFINIIAFSSFFSQPSELNGIFNSLKIILLVFHFLVFGRMQNELGAYFMHPLRHSGEQEYFSTVNKISEVVDLHTRVPNSATDGVGSDIARCFRTR